LADIVQVDLFFTFNKKAGPCRFQSGFIEDEFCFPEQLVGKQRKNIYPTSPQNDSPKQQSKFLLKKCFYSQGQATDRPTYKPGRQEKNGKATVKMPPRNDVLRIVFFNLERLHRYLSGVVFSNRLSAQTQETIDCKDRRTLQYPLSSFTGWCCSFRETGDQWSLTS